MPKKIDPSGETGAGEIAVHDYSTPGRVFPENIPQELKSSCAFCVWKKEKKEGRLTKIPYDPRTGQKARTNDPETFADFDTALFAYESGGWSGIGIRVSEGIGAIDIDGCIREDGSLNDVAATVLGIFKDAYFERSPSGTGLRGFFRVAPDFVYDKATYYVNNRKYGLEIYLPETTNRFVTVTGNVYRAGEVSLDMEALRAVLDEFMMRKEPATPRGRHNTVAVSVSDEEALSLARSDHRDGQKFRALFDEGRWEGPFASHSEADLSLCRLIARKCGDNPEQIDRLFRQSSLMRDKWDERRGASTYGALTVRKGIFGARLESGQKLSEIELAAAVLSEHDFLYHEATGFYEYDVARGIWVRRTTTEVGGIVRDLTNGFAKSALIAGVVRQLQFACVSRIPLDGLNKAPVMVFANGVLNLETLEFSREFSRKHYATIALPYCYDPAAACPSWKHFLKTALGSPAIVSLPDPESPDGDGLMRDPDGWARERILQEFSGYTLFCSNRELQMALMMIGEGANGKSLFLNLIIRVFGEENCAHVSIGDMSRSFHIMPLKDKMLNVSTDEGRAFNDGEEVFKRLSAGDVVADSWKGRDRVNFEPRCKMWLAANRMPKARDKSFGFERRFLFVDFNNRFTRKPTRPGDLEADTALEGRLQKELPGIFLWCLGGYKRLKAQGHFSESPDQNKRLDELRSTVNPLRNFVNEVVVEMRGRSYRSELYSAYRNWCMGNGHAPLNARGFHTELVAAMNEEQIAFREGKARDRYYEFLNF